MWHNIIIFQVINVNQFAIILNNNYLWYEQSRQKSIQRMKAIVMILTKTKQFSVNQASKHWNSNKVNHQYCLGIKI